MALGKLPYRRRIISRSVDSNGVPALMVEIRDADNVLIATKTSNVDPGVEISSVLDRLMIDQQILDSGGQLALLDAMIASYPTKSLAEGDPAYVPDSITLNGIAVGTWTNMPAALTELAGSRVRLSLALASELRFVANIVTAGAASAEIRLQYSADNGTTWNYFGAPNSPTIPISTTGSKESAWIPVPQAAQGDVLIRIGGINGNGVLDPQFGLTLLQVR